MNLEQQVAALVTASNDLTAEVAGKQAAIDAKVAAKIAELEAWRGGARSEMALPFVVNIKVGGDANTYYPVPIRLSRHNSLGRVVISRDHSAPHPASLGADHVAGLVLDMRVRADGWADFSHTRIDYYGFAYHNAVARLLTMPIGRVVWLRGGGMEYQISSDYDMKPGAIIEGTENLKPIIAANAMIYPENASGGFAVAALAAPDTIFGSPITTPTAI